MESVDDRICPFWPLQSLERLDTVSADLGVYLLRIVIKEAVLAALAAQGQKIEKANIARLSFDGSSFLCSLDGTVNDHSHALPVPEIDHNPVDAWVKGIMDQKQT